MATSEAPDVAALLARVEEIYRDCTATGLACRAANSHTSPTNWQCMDCEKPMHSPMDRDRSALALVPPLATALRAALADQRRYQWLQSGGHQRIYVSEPVEGGRWWSYGVQRGNAYSRRGQFATFDEATDAAIAADMTCDGAT